MATATAPAFRANLAALFDALACTAPAAPVRPPLPILGSVVVDVGNDGTVQLSAFDYEVSVETSVDGALAKEPGRAVVSRADLLRILKAACKGETKSVWSGWDVELTTTATTDVRGSAESRTTVATHEADVEVGGFAMPVVAFAPAEYPSLPVMDGVAGFVVDRDQLAAALSRVQLAAGSDDTLPALTGIKVELDEHSITLAATDRFRLAVGTVAAEPRPGADEHGVAALLPRGSFVALLERMPAGPITVDVDAAGSTVRLDGAGTVATARVLDAEFPRFRALLPNEVPHTFTADAKQLSKVIGKAVALGARKGPVRITGDGETVRVAPYDSELPEGRVRGAAVPVSGSEEGLDFCADGRYLADALKAFTGEVAVGVQHLARTTKPIMLAGSLADLGDVTAYRHMVMPVRMPS